MLVHSDAGAPAIDLCAGTRASRAAATTAWHAAEFSFEINVVQPDTSATTSDAILAAMELYDATGARWALQLEVSYDTSKTALDLNLSENRTFVDGGTGRSSRTVRRVHPPGRHLDPRVARDDPRDGERRRDRARQRLERYHDVDIGVTPGTVNATPEILVGGAFAEKSSHGWTVRYDDVFFEVQ